VKNSKGQRSFTKAVVTGGAGFIGSHLVRQLLGEGCAVTVVERPGANLANLRGLDVNLLTADVSIPGSILSALDDCAVLFHTAGNPQLWARYPNEFKRVNTEGTRLVLESAQSARVPRVVFTSTESIIGRAPNGEPSDEDTPACEADMVGSYCVSKYLAEQAAFEAAKCGLDVVIVNPTIPVGPGDVNQTPPTRLILGFLNGRTPAYMDCDLNVVDVRAVAAGHILAWRRGVSGRRYILGDQNMSVLELLEAVGGICGIKPPRLRVPYSAGLAVAYVSQIVSDHLTGREPSASITGVRLTRRMAHLDCTRAKRELGFQPGSVQEALSDAVDWYRQAGWIPARTLEVAAS
jgi:dihydroflavonol-4-reductase